MYDKIFSRFGIIRDKKMKENITLIKKILVVGLILLVLLVSAEFFLGRFDDKADYVVIIRELLLAIIGGTIAGVIVELIEKTYKYRIDKRNNIRRIFAYATSLYEEFYFLHCSMLELLQDKRIQIPENLFSNKKMTLYNINNKLFEVDYYTFSKNNEFYKIHMNFRIGGIDLIGKTINETSVFKKACLEMRIKALKKEENSKNNIYKVLSILDNKFLFVLDLLDKYIKEEQKVDEWNKWEPRRKHIHNSYLGLYSFESVDKYIKENMQERN